MLCRQLFSSYMYVVKAAEMTLVQKIRTFNVDEISYWMRIDLILDTEEEQLIIVLFVSYLAAFVLNCDLLLVCFLLDD